MEEIFDEERRQLAREYNRHHRRNNWIYRGISLILLYLFFHYSLEFKLASVVGTIVNNRELSLVLFVSLLYTGYFLVDLIIDFWLYYRLNRQYRLSNQDPGSWLGDKIKSFFLSVIFVYLAARLFMLTINIWPRCWWLPFTVAGSLFTVLIQYLLPVLILPLFFELTPYPETPLKQRLTNLFKQAGVEVAGIYEFDLSTKINAANAAVVGIGNTRKILLGDNLNQEFSNREIEGIMAHEIGHHVHGDLYKNILIQPLVLGTISLLVSLIWPGLVEIRGYAGVDSLASLPLLFIIWSFWSWLITPLQLAFSRHLEKQADRFALDLIDNPRDFARGLARIADQSLAELNYGWYKRYFRASHPPIISRVNQALNWRKTDKF